MENLENQDSLNTSKVLTALTKLEAHLGTLTGTAAEGTTARLQELSALKTENRDLKTKHKTAAKRLDTLITQIAKQS